MAPPRWMLHRPTFAQHDAAAGAIHTIKGEHCLAPQRHPKGDPATRPDDLEKTIRPPCPQPVEDLMRNLKPFSERIASRDPDRQTAEIHIRVASMNRFNALGTAEIERVA